MCAMTHSNVLCDWFTCHHVTHSHASLVSMTSAYVHVGCLCLRMWHDSFKCVPWLIHMCCVAQSHTILVSMKSAYVHIAHVNESWHTFEWVMSHHVTHSHAILVSMTSAYVHIAHVNESWHTFEWVMSHHVTHSHAILVSMTSAYVHVGCLCLIYDMTHLNVCHDSFTCAVWLIHMKSLYLWPQPTYT